jgi:uncharacterized protein (TIGR02246 family)
MKRLRSLPLFFLLLWALAVPSLAQEADPEVMAEIKDLLKQHDEAMNNQNLTSVMEMYAAGPKTVLMGTGPGERWVGKEEIKSAYAEFFKDFDPGSMTSKCTWTVGDYVGDMAWLMAMCRITDYLANQQRDYALNLSAVLEKQEGKWHFRALHFSNLTGGQ